MRFYSIINHGNISDAVSELSFQEGSVYNSEMECIQFDQQSQTEPLDVKLEQADDKSESHYSVAQVAVNSGGQVQVSYQLISNEYQWLSMPLCHSL